MRQLLAEGPCSTTCGWVACASPGLTEPFSHLGTSLVLPAGSEQVGGEDATWIHRDASGAGVGLGGAAPFLGGGQYCGKEGGLMWGERASADPDGS